MSCDEARGSRIDVFKVFFLLMSVIMLGWAVFMLAGASDTRIASFNDDVLTTWLMPGFGIESRRAILTIVLLVSSLFSAWVGALLKAPAQRGGMNVHDRRDSLFLAVFMPLSVFVAFPVIGIMEYPLDDRETVRVIDKHIDRPHAVLEYCTGKKKKPGQRKG